MRNRDEFTRGEQSNMLLSAPTRLGIYMTSTYSYSHCIIVKSKLFFAGKSFVELVRYLFKQNDVKSFLSQ